MLKATTVNRNSSNICCFYITVCPSSSCDSITTEVTTNYISESSSTASPLYTTTHVNEPTSATVRKSSAFHHTTFYSGSSLTLNLPETSVTQRYSSLHSRSEFGKISTITIVSSFQTSQLLESISSLKLSPSSLSLVSSSSLLLLSTPSRSSSSVLFPTTSHGVLSFLTPSPTRNVKSSSVTLSPSTVRSTDGIEIEIKPHHNVSVLLLSVTKPPYFSLYFVVLNFGSCFYF